MATSSYVCLVGNADELPVGHVGWVMSDGSLDREQAHTPRVEIVGEPMGWNPTVADSWSSLGMVFPTLEMVGKAGLWGSRVSHGCPCGSCK